jgi:Na+/melibiose symporter-like transporter
MQGAAYIFLIVFAIAMLFIYISVRRRKLPMGTAGVVGCVVNSLCFTLFSVARQMSLVQAIIMGLFFGCLFTLMNLIAASYFNQQENAKAATASTPQTQ